MPLALSRLRVKPTQAGYGLERQADVLAISHDGPQSNYRQGVPNGVFFVNAVFDLKADGYDYIRAFFRTTIANGHLPFTADLIVQEDDLVNRTCKFVPGTFKLAGLFQPDIFRVTASLEVRPS